MKVSELPRYLTVNALRQATSEVTYKEGFKFDVFEKPFEGPYLQILATVPDAFGSDETTLRIYSPIPQMARVSRENFYDWLLERVIRVEIHEAMEFFRVKGELWDDPHSIQP